MDVTKVAVGDLVIDERNARRGSVADLMDSLREFGQHRPIVVQRETGRVIVGNHMLQAAIALGWAEVDVTHVDDDDETALRRSLADNLVGDRAKWDDTQLASLIAELDDAHSVPGIDDSLIDRLLKEVGPPVEAPLLPITARPAEGYDYVVVVADNTLDRNWLHETVGLTQTRSYKAPTRVGQSRIVTVDQLRSAMNRAVERGQVV